MKYLTKNKHWKIHKDCNVDKILYLLTDRPDYINHYNDFKWIDNKGEIRRNYNLPLYIIFHSVNFAWFINEKIL